MRIHTNRLTEQDLRDALRNASGKAPQVTLTVQGQHGSRSHNKAFEVALRGEGRRHTKRPNTGITGAGSEYAATYDDWGWFLAYLFESDEQATAGPYRGHDDFDRKTKYAYEV